MTASTRVLGAGPGSRMTASTRALIAAPEAA
jgi:hypothetical protein